MTNTKNESNVTAPRWWTRHAGLRDVLFAALALGAWLAACTLDAGAR